MILSLPSRGARDTRCFCALCLHVTIFLQTSRQFAWLPVQAKEEIACWLLASLEVILMKTFSKIPLFILDRPLDEQLLVPFHQLSQFCEGVILVLVSRYFTRIRIPVRLHVIM